uniref:Secreted protein n=1 Tax=Mus spicilegus TaxID=10103 RepID=A0A8C6GTY2_MUSSI
MIRRPERAVFSPGWALGRLLACLPQLSVLSGGEGSSDGQFFLCPGLRAARWGEVSGIFSQLVRNPIR